MKISNAVTLCEKRILPLYVSKQRDLAFYGQKVICLHLNKSKRVIAEIKIRRQNCERSLPLYASKQRRLAQLSRNGENLYVADTK
jgi:hypothetical protein